MAACPNIRHASRWLSSGYPFFVFPDGNKEDTALFPLVLLLQDGSLTVGRA